MTTKVATIKSFGQKIWLDNISREFLASGQLQQMINQDGIAGLTSNPAIFYKAISSDKLYQQQLDELKKSDLSPDERYEKIVINDIIQACDIMLPLYNDSKAEDGYVSLEVSPQLCHDASGTVNSAKELWRIINRPNLMIKVPATKAGVVAFEELVKIGINVNITLLFSLSQVNSIWEAYLRGLNYRVAKGLPVENIKTVASFFISRVDSAVDPLLPATLQGKAAINLAKCAYLDYLKIFNGPQFNELKRHGAKSQYLLWASTGTKNKNYSDVLYIEELIGPETINTAPDATLDAFRDHGKAANRLTSEIDNAREILQQIEANGINLEELGQKLQDDGLKLFDEAYNQLIELVK